MTISWSTSQPGTSQHQGGLYCPCSHLETGSGKLTLRCFLSFLTAGPQVGSTHLTLDPLRLCLKSSPVQVTAPPTQDQHQTIRRCRGGLLNTGRWTACLSGVKTTGPDVSETKDREEQELRVRHWDAGGPVKVKEDLSWTRPTSA